MSQAPIMSTVDEFENWAGPFVHDQRMVWLGDLHSNKYVFRNDYKKRPSACLEYPDDQPKKNKMAIYKEFIDKIAFAYNHQSKKSIWDRKRDHYLESDGGDTHKATKDNPRVFQFSLKKMILGDRGTSTCASRSHPEAMFHGGEREAQNLEKALAFPSPAGKGGSGKGRRRKQKLKRMRVEEYVGTNYGNL